MYEFAEQLSGGEQKESFLDAFFEQWFDVQPVGMWLQKKGIDREFCSRKDGRTWTVEYKADNTAARTGNVFIETISVDVANRLGWAYTSIAQLLMYYIPPLRKIYVLPMTAIKRNLPDWVRRFRKSPPIPNDGYNTFGVLVPLDEIAAHCYGVIDMQVAGVDEL